MGATYVAVAASPSTIGNGRCQRQCQCKHIAECKADSVAEADMATMEKGYLQAVLSSIPPMATMARQWLCLPTMSAILNLPKYDLPIKTVISPR